MNEKEKRKRMALNSEDMPDNVYKILNEKAMKRSLTNYIIELVQESFKTKDVSKKLDSIEDKIDLILSNGVTLDMNTNRDNLEEDSLKEGMLVEASTVVGGIDEADKVEYDF
jgi:replicative DNA helicase